MSIPVTCSCGKRFTAPDNLAGKRVKCPACQQPVTIPGASSSHKTNAAKAPPPAETKKATANTKPVATNVAIGVRCSCGKIVKAGPKLLGKRVKCPGCGQPLKIPDSPASQAAPEKMTTPKLSASAAVHSAAAATVMGALFDEIGFGTSIAKTRCPACKFDIDPEAVLCVKCGYHLELGKHLTTKVIKRKRL